MFTICAQMLSYLTYLMSAQLPLAVETAVEETVVETKADAAPELEHMLLEPAAAAD